ncbi:MAG: hypothetical protein ABIJ18_04905 [archaeon]
MKSLYQLNLETDSIIYEYFYILSKYEKKKCQTCGIIQGEPLKGFKKYYCKHITSKVDENLKERKKEMCYKLIDFFTCQEFSLTL